MTVNIGLWAKAGSISLPGAGDVTFWGFARDSAEAPQLPGPIIEVIQHESAEIVLTNEISTPVSLTFPGQEFTPDPVKDPNGVFISYNQNAEPGASATFNITPSRPGVFLYESGTRQEQQIQMGLYGIMVVRPSGYASDNPSTWTAYGPETGTDYDVEKILVINEVDTKMHQALARQETPEGYNPDYFTINGRSYPDSIKPDGSSSQPYSSLVTAKVGQKVLLRIINAGFLNHTLTFLGGTFRVVASDSWPLKSQLFDTTYDKYAVTLGSGQSYDLLFEATSPGKYLLYDRDLNHAVNDNDFPGGIISFIEVEPEQWNTGTGSVFHPTVQNFLLDVF